MAERTMTPPPALRSKFLVAHGAGSWAWRPWWEGGCVAHVDGLVSGRVGDV